MVRINDLHVSHGSTYDDAYCDSCNNPGTSDCFGKDIDFQVVKNNNLFRDYDDDFGNDSDDTHGFTIIFGTCPDNVDTCWYYFHILNNGEIPED